MYSPFPCAFSVWTPGIGDPHPVGWAIVGLYLVVAARCVRAAREARRASVSSASREATFWWLCALLLAALAVNKQLDLQSLLTSFARCLALEQGWYEGRRHIQILFVRGVMVLGVLSLVLSAWYFRKTFRRTGLAILGLAFVTTFVVVRAASFHHVDVLIDRSVLGLRLNWILEGVGPLLILVATSWPRRIPRT